MGTEGPLQQNAPATPTGTPSSRTKLPPVFVNNNIEAELQVPLDLSLSLDHKALCHECLLTLLSQI